MFPVEAQAAEMARLEATIKPYALLTRAMEDSGKVGIARFVMRGGQRWRFWRRPLRSIAA